MYDYIKIPEIIDDVKFVNLTLDLYGKMLKRIQKNGRAGQSQDGVDIYGYTEDNELVGIQCKVKSKADFENKNFKTQFLNEIRQEIAKGQNFSSKLKSFLIITTAPRDASVQKEIIELDNDIFQQNGFHIKIIFWDDISDMLTNEVHKETYIKYYGNLIVETVVGDVKGKLLNLKVGVKNRDNSHYELLLGLTVKRLDYPNGVSYYSNSCFLVDLNNKTFDTFPGKCYPSDLEIVIKNQRDRYTITDWLNSINVNKELENSNREYEFLWNEKQFNNYLKRFDEE